MRGEYKGEKSKNDRWREEWRGVKGGWEEEGKRGREDRRDGRKQRRKGRKGYRGGK